MQLLHPFPILRQILTVFLGTFLLMPAPEGRAAPSTESPAILTLETAITTALEKNPDIGIAADRIAMAEAALAETRALFRPSLSVFSEFSTGDAPSAYLFKTIDQRELPPNTDFNDPGTFTNLETGVMAHWNLYNGGRDMASSDLAQANILAGAAQLKGQRNQVVSSVIHLFFAALKADEYITIARQSVDTVKEQLRIMEVRYEGGGVLKSDILSLKVRLAEAGKDLVQSRNRYDTTLTALFHLMGEPPRDGIRLDGNCECPVTFPSTYPEAWETARVHRPEMQWAEARLEQARLELKRAGAGRLPRIHLQARYYLDSEDLDMDLDKDNYTAALAMNWPLYSGGAVSAQKARAAHGVKMALNEKRKVALAIFEDVKKAYLNHQDARQRCQVAGTSVEMAEESLQLVKKRYIGGSEPVTRYLESELALNRSRINRAAAFYDEKSALSDIGRSLGILATLWSEQQGAPEK